MFSEEDLNSFMFSIYLAVFFVASLFLIDQSYQVHSMKVLKTTSPALSKNKDQARLRNPSVKEGSCSGFTYCMRIYFNILNKGQIFGFDNKMFQFKSSWPNFFFQ